MITICLTYFRSLTLANLAAALYSVRRQDLTNVKEVIVVDNDTTDSVEAINEVVRNLEFPIPVGVHSYKHGIPYRTHSWSANQAIGLSSTRWIFFTRADYLLDFDIVLKFANIAASRLPSWRGFITSNGCHLTGDVASVEATDWRKTGPRFQGSVYDYTDIDSGVWMTRRRCYEEVGGLDEKLYAWGHSQTHFQYKLWLDEVEFVRVPEVLFYHPWHEGHRDLDLAQQQLGHVGVSLKEMWARYGGRSPYA